MSKVVRISENTYQRMQKIAKPFDDTPDTVIQNLLDFYEKEKLGKKPKQSTSTNKDDPMILEVENPSDLTHTKVWEGHFNNKTVRNWRELVSVAHRTALNKLGSFSELRKLSISNIVEGVKEESGFKPIDGTNISIQGANANSSWDSALIIAKRLNMPLRMKFKWRNKKGVSHPHKTGILEWKPN